MQRRLPERFLWDPPPSTWQTRVFSLKKPRSVHGTFSRHLAPSHGTFSQSSWHLSHHPATFEPCSCFSQTSQSPSLHRTADVQFVASGPCAEVFEIPVFLLTKSMLVHGTLRGKGNGRLPCWTTRCCSWDAIVETVLRTLRVCPIRTGFERAKSPFQELKHDESSSNKCGISAPCHYFVCPGKNSGGRDDETCHDGR